MVREIVIWPDPILKARARSVAKPGKQLHALIRDLFETLYSTPDGIGLAAPQIGVGKRVVVIDLSQGSDPRQRMVLVNPEVTDSEGECLSEESCLSVPGESGTVVRAERVRVEAMDERGRPFHIDADDFLAIVLQHEIDHLHGKVYVDRMPAAKRAPIRRRMRALKTQRKARAKKPLRASPKRRAPRARSAAR